jgi:hypothetical protein
MSDFDDFGGPAWAPDLFLPNGKLARFCKGADQGAAIKEQKAARLQSAAQFAEQMALMRQQYDDAQKIKTPTYAPAAQLSASNPDAYAARLDSQRRQQRRFGSRATILRPAMGGATLAAA